MGLWNKSVIGMELDSQEIRAVELKGSQKKPVVSAWGRIRLPEGVVKDGRVIESKSFSAHAERLLNENGFKNRDVVLGVNNQDVIVRFASFPKVPEDKIRNMIRFQAQDYIPVSLEELELDYVVVGEKKTEEGEFINVILVGARKKMLNDFIEALSGANLNIREIDSTMLALGRAALIESQDGTFALAGFNNDIGNILIFKDGILGMARSVSITQSPAWIASREAGMRSQDQDMTILADILFGEIKSSVGYFKMQSNTTIDKLLILGCGATQERVAARLTETTGLSVTIPKVYTTLGSQSVKGNTSSFKAADYVASISLAMRGLGEK
ncbi:MAG: pilus assembly protein PilM [Clostridia bacterium]|nr:pilus assembly protein PilM [Clostridia bacterium]